jgi:hypothetical protein
MSLAWEPQQIGDDNESPNLRTTVCRSNWESLGRRILAVCVQYFGAWNLVALGPASRYSEPCPTV